MLAMCLFSIPFTPPPRPFSLSFLLRPGYVSPCFQKWIPTRFLHCLSLTHEPPVGAETPPHPTLSTDGPAPSQGPHWNTCGHTGLNRDKPKPHPVGQYLEYRRSPLSPGPAPPRAVLQRGASIGHGDPVRATGRPPLSDSGLGLSGPNSHPNSAACASVGADPWEGCCGALRPPAEAGPAVQRDPGKFPSTPIPA